MIIDVASSDFNPKKIPLQFDTIVVGSGAAGAVIAEALAKAGQRVAIVEEGPAATPETHRDISFDAVARLYRNFGFTTTLGQPAIPIPVGRVLGGTTVINSGTCFRTPEKVLSHWSEGLGLTDFAPHKMNAIFEQIESELHVVPAAFDVMNRSNQIVAECATHQGWKGAPLARAIRKCEGCGYCCYGCPSGAKQSVDISYLPQAFAAGAVAFVNAKVKHLLFIDKKCTGVRIRNSVDLYANAVCVSAGTLYSPSLLRESGVARSNRHLGRNLTLHPATKVFAEFEEDLNSWEGTPQAYGLEAMRDEGIFFQGVFVPPDIAAMTVPFVGSELKAFMAKYRKMASYGFLVSDSSTGSIYSLPLISRWIGPVIRYSFTPHDLVRIQKAVAFLARLFLRGSYSQSAKRVITLIHGHRTLENERDVNRLENARLRGGDIDCMAFHPLGTCRIATTPLQGVVGPDFQVFGVSQLFVCDGSVVPTSLGVNPQVTIMAFAKKCAQSILTH